MQPLLRSPGLSDDRRWRAALATFLDSLLAVEDEASLLGFNHETRMFGEWTTERAGLRTKLEGLRPSGGTALYDAIDAALPQFESRQHPRAAILLVSELAKMPGVVVPKIDGAFYAVVKLPIDDSDRFCEWLVKEFRFEGQTEFRIIGPSSALLPACSSILSSIPSPFNSGRSRFAGTA